jgi:hypothetical protein
VQKSCVVFRLLQKLNAIWHESCIPDDRTQTGRVSLALAVPLFLASLLVFRSVSMKNMFQGFLRSEDGFLLSSEALLIGTIAVLGLLVGLVSIRDAVVQELGDFGQAISLLDQSYTYTGVNDAGTSTNTTGSAFADSTDLGDAIEATDANGINVTGVAAATE